MKRPIVYKIVRLDKRRMFSEFISVADLRVEYILGKVAKTKGLPNGLKLPVFCYSKPMLVGTGYYGRRTLECTAKSIRKIKWMVNTCALKEMTDGEIEEQWTKILYEGSPDREYRMRVSPHTIVAWDVVPQKVLPDFGPTLPQLAKMKKWKGLVEWLQENR